MPLISEAEVYEWQPYFLLYGLQMDSLLRMDCAIYIYRIDRNYDGGGL